MQPEPNAPLSKPRLLWSARTTNRKTGDMPTALVGITKAETRASCDGCPLLPSRVCYAHNGTPRMGAASVQRAVGAGHAKRYTLAHALRYASRAARFVRVSSIGDAGRVDPRELREAHDTVRAAGLGWLAFTHFPAEALANGTEDLFLASVDGPDVPTVLAAADGWLDAGFKRVSVVVPDTWTAPSTRTEAGRKAVLCPAVRTASRVQCNLCGLCAPRAKGADIVMFPDHGPAARGRARRNAAEGV
jgi:hypothetical protein